MLALKCNNLGKAFGRRWLFRRLSFTVPQGTGLVILGPNGSGKTTLLRLMCGLVQPTEGKIVWEINGSVLRPSQVRSLIGAVLPDCEPYGELTAEENMQLVADLHGINKNYANEWLERVGLAHAKRQLINEFSSGMKLRLKLAMALVHEPMALLLDEPTAMLDEQGRQLVSELVAEQKRKGIVIVATNDERDVGYGEQQIVLGKNR
ncbi:MAG: ABC transporter ATP-binding protein [Armatimonadota bacterium]|nr:ABC transporter ATP-binding protein [Armatimonadota bacterium]MDW8144188.1 ABC transporter ATP-binding protein [Armatimonadota bacterium]